MKAKKDRRKASGGKEGSHCYTSQPIEGLEKGKSVVGKPTTSRKMKATQSHKVSPILILKAKIQKKYY